MTEFNKVFNDFSCSNPAGELYKEASKKLFNLFRNNYLISPAENWKMEDKFGDIGKNKIVIVVPTEVHNQHNFTFCYVAEIENNGSMEIYKVLNNCFHKNAKMPIRKPENEKKVLFEKVLNVLMETNKSLKNNEIQK